MRTSTRTLLRIAFAFALIVGCFALAACSSPQSSGDDSSASSAAASSAIESTSASASASASADDSSASSSAASTEATATTGALGTAPEVEKEKNPDAVAGTETTPALMPASHESYLSEAVLPCQTCHGLDEKGQPKAADAAELPKGHYVNEDPSTGQIDPSRAQCISCHVVDPDK